MGCFVLYSIDVYIIRIFEYIRISYANIRIPISAFVDIPRKKLSWLMEHNHIASLLLNVLNELKGESLSPPKDLRMPGYTSTIKTLQMNL